MDTLTATITEFIAQTSQLQWAALTAVTMALLLIALLSEHFQLKRKFSQVEARLLDRSIGTHSRNWTATALNLEKKAHEPGEVARSSALTYLHLLDEAAEAWLKGSQWQDALRVTQRLLLESSHAIGKPGLGENDYRACADLIENRLSTYPDLSKAANEAAENAVRFLTDIDVMMSIHDQPARIVQLRDLVAEVAYAVERHHGLSRVKAS